VGRPPRSALEEARVAPRPRSRCPCTGPGAGRRGQDRGRAGLSSARRSRSRRAGPAGHGVPSTPAPGLAVALGVCCSPVRPAASPPQYGIVLDAGSSHTAVFIYKWPADKENDTGVVSEHSMCDVEGKGCPGGRWQGLSHPLRAGQRDGAKAPAMPSCLAGCSLAQRGGVRGPALFPTPPPSPPRAAATHTCGLPFPGVHSTARRQSSSVPSPVRSQGWFSTLHLSNLSQAVSRWGMQRGQGDVADLWMAPCPEKPAAPTL